MNNEQLEFVRKSLKEDVSDILKRNNIISLLFVLQVAIGVSIFMTPETLVFSGLFLLNLFLIHNSIIKLKWALITFKAGIQLFDAMDVNTDSEPFEMAKDKLEKAPMSWSFLVNYL